MSISVTPLPDGWTRVTYVDHPVRSDDGAEHLLNGTITRADSGELDIGIVRAPEPNGKTNDFSMFTETLTAAPLRVLEDGEWIELHGGTFDLGWETDVSQGELHIESPS
jgi:hypothetical protein